MTKVEIQALLERVLAWPQSMQDEAAATLLGIEAAGDLAEENPWPLTGEERAELEEAEREIERGDAAASDAEVAAIFRLARR
jgi:formiminotetrahydrofolate cyclodeaminase